MALYFIPEPFFGSLDQTHAFPTSPNGTPPVQEKIENTKQALKDPQFLSLLKKHKGNEEMAIAERLATSLFGEDPSEELVEAFLC